MRHWARLRLVISARARAWTGEQLNSMKRSRSRNMEEGGQRENFRLDDVILRSIVQLSVEAFPLETWPIHFVRAPVTHSWPPKRLTMREKNLGAPQFTRLVDASISACTRTQTNYDALAGYGRRVMRKREPISGEALGKCAVPPDLGCWIVDSIRFLLLSMLSNKVRPLNLLHTPNVSLYRCSRSPESYRLACGTLAAVAVAAN